MSNEYYKSSDDGLVSHNKKTECEKPKIIMIKGNNNGKNIVLHKQPKKSKNNNNKLDKLSIFKRYDEI